MPPALAVVEGMAGAIRPSAKARPYANPSVLLPNALTKSVATRSPRPVFSKPCKRKKRKLTPEQILPVLAYGLATSAVSASQPL